MSAELVNIGLAKPDADVIAQIERLLARAKDGDVRALIFVTEDRDCGTTTSMSGTKDIMKMIGQCHRLAYRLQRDLDEAASAAGAS